ncbi:MAG: virulence factor [Actinomycetes bacterium]
MAEVQITRWREIPSIVTAREGDEVIKVQLPSRFQEAIDEAAMRAGAEDADAYLAGWTRDPWVAVAGSATEAAESVAHDVEKTWTEPALTALLDSIGPSTSGEQA